MDEKDTWYVVLNTFNNVLGYGNKDYDTVKEWCEQMILRPDVKYEIIKVVRSNEKE